MLHWAIDATTILNATHHVNIVVTLFRMVATLFQHCYAVARKKSLLRIFPCYITLRERNRDWGHVHKNLGMFKTAVSKQCSFDVRIYWFRVDRRVIRVKNYAV